MASRNDIQVQLNGKVHWNASDREVREWLMFRHGIDGEMANEMIAAALRARAASIRKISLFRGTIAFLVAVPLLVLAWMGMETEGRRMTGKALFLGSTGLACLGYAGKQFLQVITGKSDVAIDA